MDAGFAGEFSNEEMQMAKECLKDSEAYFEDDMPVDFLLRRQGHL